MIGCNLHQCVNFELCSGQNFFIFAQFKIMADLGFKWNIFSIAYFRYILLIDLENWSKSAFHYWCTMHMVNCDFFSVSLRINQLPVSRFFGHKCGTKFPIRLTCYIEFTISQCLLSRFWKQFVRIIPMLHIWFNKVVGICAPDHILGPSVPRVISPMHQFIDWLIKIFL